MHGIHDSWSQYKTNGIQVVCGPGHEISGASGLVKGERHLLDVGKEVVPQIVFNIAAHSDQNFPHPETEKAFKEGYAYDQAGIKQKIIQLNTGQQIIDNIFQDLRVYQTGDDGQDNHQKTYAKPPLVLSQIRYELYERVFHFSDCLLAAGVWSIRVCGSRMSI